MLLGAPAKPPAMLIILRCAIWISPTFYLELNLSEEAREIAHEGFLRFEKLGMGYGGRQDTRKRKPRLMASRGRRSRLWSALPKRGRFLNAKKTSFGPGSSTCIRPCLLSTKAGTLRPGVSASRPLLSSIGQRSRESCPRASAARAHCSPSGDSAAAQKETDESLARLKRLQARFLPSRHTCSRDRLLRLATSALRRTRRTWKPGKPWKPCAAGCKAKS